MLYNPDKQNFLNDNIQYLFDKIIYEYDMQHAGLSIIKEFNLLSDKKIRELELMSKDMAHITVGKIQRDDKTFSKLLTDKFAIIRSRFIRDNSLEDNDIIAVKKDAFFVTKLCNTDQFGEVKFIVKNKYTSYIRFTDNHNIECYYHDRGIDIKGLSDSSENKHRLYMIEFLKNYFKYMENRDSSVKRFLLKFIYDYKAMKLDEGFYLEFNSKSYDINPMYNYYKLIIPLFQIVLEENI